MTDRYHVIVVDKDQFCMDEYNEEGKNEYDLYSLFEDNEEIPDGVWLEEWIVNDDEPWDSHNLYEQHGLVNNDCYLIDWNEIGKPWMIKSEAWWKEKIETMDALYKMMKSVYPVADKIIDKVVDILDPDRESLNEAMQGETYWPDYYTLGHYIYLAKEVYPLGGKEEEEETKDE